MVLKSFANQQIFTLTFCVFAACLISTVLGNTLPTPPTKCPPGISYLAHPDSCTKFFQCVFGTPKARDCPLGTVFNERFSICILAGSELDRCTPYHVNRECERGTVELIPHPTKCQGYYNCSDPVKYYFGYYFHNEYEKECTYPEYFDIRLKKCVGYENALCGEGRFRTKWYCNYRKNQCFMPGCRPCSVFNPSCVGKEDGLWPLTPPRSPAEYMECKSQRAVDGDVGGIKMCKSGDIFDDIQRKCIQFYHGLVTLGPSHELVTA